MKIEKKGYYQDRKPLDAGCKPLNETNRADTDMTASVCHPKDAKDRIKVRTYKKNGDADKEYFFPAIREALEEYVKLRNSIENFGDRVPYWPTIWINDGKNGYVRVHSFAYSELTDGTVEKYLAERIIDGDDLLELVAM